MASRSGRYRAAFGRNKLTSPHQCQVTLNVEKRPSLDSMTGTVKPRCTCMGDLVRSRVILFFNVKDLSNMIPIKLMRRDGLAKAL